MAEAAVANGKEAAAVNSPNRQYTLERTRNIGIAAHIYAVLYRPHPQDW
jgi:hypothetical protein